MKTKQIVILFSLSVFIISCVQQSHRKEINVELDMRNTTSSDKVGIRGQYPLSWEETTYLEDNDGDGIYEGNFEIFTAANQIEFKFVKNEMDFELQDQPNRVLTFEYKPEIIKYSAVYNNPEAKIEKE